MRVRAYLSHFVLGVGLLCALSLMLSVGVVLVRPGAVFLHQQWDGHLLGNHAPFSAYLAMIAVFTGFTLLIGCWSRLPLWCLGAVLYAGGGLINVLEMRVWGGVADFIPVGGGTLCSPGDICLWAAPAVLALGIVLRVSALTLARRRERAEARSPVETV